MKKTFTSLLLALAISGTLQAQTIADFETPLPSNDTSYLETFSTDGEYAFTSGNITCKGYIQYGGTYLNGFNYSNRQNDSVGNWLNQWSAITASGYNSNNYGIAYLEGDYNDFTQSQIFNINLEGNALGKHILGTYIVNTTYTSKWIEDNYEIGDYLNLNIKGYKNGVLSTDSVVFTLAHKDSTSLTLINDWQWLDLTSLGAVDSIALQMRTNNTLTPFYFAFDNFTTTDGICPSAVDVTINNITTQSATLNWKNIAGLYATHYEIAIDTFHTDEPGNTTNIVTVGNQTNFDFTNLEPNTNYTAHLRTICTDTNAVWQKISFNTQATNIHPIYVSQINIYPNPTTGMVYLDTKELVETVQIFNIQGKKIAQFFNTNTLDITNLPTGNYLVTIKTNTATLQQLIQKQ
jgi:hypothetical protein